jgi:cytochrome-b5 reductase
MLREMLPEPREGNIILVCGPPGFMEVRLCGPIFHNKVLTVYLQLISLIECCFWCFQAISGDKAPDKSQGELQGMLKELGYATDQVYKF